jgi:hypothetical protein
MECNQQQRDKLLQLFDELVPLLVQGNSTEAITKEAEVKQHASKLLDMLIENLDFALIELEKCRELLGEMTPESTTMFLQSVTESHNPKTLF